MRLADLSLSLLGGALLALVGCDAGGDVPVIGISTSDRFVDAARMALEDREAAGKRPVADIRTVRASTNATIPALETAEKMMAIDGLVAVVGHSNSAASLAASQIYNERGIVQVAPHSSAVSYSEAGPWSFRLVPPDDRQARYLASALDSIHPDARRVAVLYVNDDYGRGLLDDVERTLSGGPHEIVLRYPHRETSAAHLDTADVEAAMAALTDAGPDVLLWLGRGSILHLHLPSIRAVDPDLPVLGSDGVASGPHHAIDDGRWSRVRFVDFVDLDGSDALRDFARRYEERFERVATGPDALTYDATNLLLAALDNGARSAEEVRSFLVALGRDRPPWTGITGPVAFDEEGDVERNYVIRTVRDPE